MFENTAHLYDLIYRAAGRDDEREAAEIVALVDSRRPGARSLLDVACGTGAHLVHLQPRFLCAGVDLDEGMLAQARSRLDGVDLVAADMRTLALGRTFDAVVCLFSSIGYMTSTEDLDAAIAAMRAHLADGGVLVVDGWVRPEAWRDPGSVHAVSVRDGTTAVARVGRSRREGRTTILEMHHLVATVEDGVSLLVDEHRLTLFTHDEYVAAFTRAGLTPEPVPGAHRDRDRYVAVTPG